MRKTLLVLSHEVYMLTSRLSFWFAIIGLPLVGFLVYGGAALINQRQEAGIPPAVDPMAVVGKVINIEPDPRPQGYVDPGGLIRAFPADFSKELLVAFPDQARARRALDAGEISAFYVIAEDYTQSGKLTLYLPEYKLMSGANNAGLESLINFNLLGGDASLFRGIDQPFQPLEWQSLAAPKNAIREDNSQAALAICMGVLLLFFVGIMGSSTLMLNSLTNEKENRVIETLMVSVSPTQLMVGKIAGLGLIGLGQMLVWLLSMLVILRLSGDTFDLPAGFILQPSFVAWGVLFFLLGYLEYAAILAGIGALVPDLREASLVTTVVMLPVLVPEMLVPVIISNPHGTLAVIFSLFPFTAPIMVMMRLAMDEVPLWQLLLSIAILVLTVLLIMRAAAGLFRAQTLLTGKGFQLSVILRQLRGVHKN